MAYDTQELQEKALSVIQKHNLVFIEDVVAYLPCAKSTFYEHFPNESDNYKKISELLEKNKVNMKVAMRSKWYKSDNPTLQMGLMKLLSTDRELRKLSMEHREHSGSVSLFDALTEEPYESDNQEE